LCRSGLTHPNSVITRLVPSHSPSCRAQVAGEAAAVATSPIQFAAPPVAKGAPPAYAIREYYCPALQLTPRYHRTIYYVPASVSSSELAMSLNDSLGSDSDVSIWPPGWSVQGGSLVWQGAQDLAPTVSATNPKADDRRTSGLFWGGVFLGVAAAAGTGFVGEIALILLPHRIRREQDTETVRSS